MDVLRVRAPFFRGVAQHLLAAVLRLATRTKVSRLVFSARRLEQKLPAQLRTVGTHRVRRWKLLWNLTLSDPLQRGLFFRGEGTFPRLSRQIAHTIRPGDTVMDVGANIGSFALPVVAHAKAQTVYAFEPAASTFQRLQENVALNRLAAQVIPVHVALGETRDRRLLRERERFGSNASSTFTLQGSGTPVEEVSVTSVDRWFEESGAPRIDVVKIDVEGSELAVVKGMSKLLSGPSRPRSLIVEVIDTFLEQAGGSWQVLRDVLGSHGYEAYEPMDGGGLQRVSGVPSVRDVIFIFTGSARPATNAIRDQTVTK